MPRNKTYQKYDNDKLLHAVAAVRNKTMTIRRASQVFGVPHSTLGDRIRIGVSAEKPGKLRNLFINYIVLIMITYLLINENITSFKTFV